MKILIVGDSWGWGCMDPSNINFEPGNEFASVLKKLGYDVTNISKCGYANSETTKEISVELKENKYDYVIWVQTDFMRDYGWQVNHPEDPPQTVKTPYGELPKYDMNMLYADVKRAGNLLSLIEVNLKSHYSTLHQLSIKHNTPIICLGGCTKLLPSVAQFTRLTPLIYSIPEMLIPGHIDSPIYETNAWLSTQYADTCMAGGDLAIIQEWFKISKECVDKMTAWWSSKDYFYPDKHHPNIAGHARIAAKVHEYLESKTNK